MKLPSPRLERRSALLHALAMLPAMQLAPNALAISATTMTGKTKAELNMVLVEPVRAQGGTSSAELVLSDGLLASAAFDSKWGLAEGGYYDIEAKTKDGDAAFVQLKTLGAGERLENLKKSWFTDAILSVDGRYGAYGAPTDVKVISDTPNPTGRILEIAFTALSPGMAEVQRRAVVSALQPKGSTDVLMLVASSSAARWKKSNAQVEARQAADTFRVTAVRKTELKQIASTDYRFGKTSGPEGMRSRNDGF